MRSNGRWQVLPGLGQARMLDVTEDYSEGLGGIHRGELAMLLGYREPWADGWTLVSGMRIGPEDAIAHAIIWADFRREIEGSAIDGELARGVRDALRGAGVTASRHGHPGLEHRLVPAARVVLGVLRGIL